MKQHFFHFDDDRKLSWYEGGEGPPLVLLHGWSISAAAFEEVADRLCQDFHILVPDLPGHGNSSVTIDNDLAGLADDLTTWLQKVADEPVILAGWSLGGMLAMQIASNSLHPLKQLVLIGTTPRFTNKDDWSLGLPAAQVHALKRNLKRHFEKTLAEFFRLTLSGEAISPERLRAIRNFAVINKPLPEKDTAVSFLEVLACQDQRESLASIDCPVLVMHGSEDQVSPIAAGRYIAEAVKDGSLVEFPGVGHAPFWSKPEVFADTLREHC